MAPGSLGLLPAGLSDARGLVGSSFHITQHCGERLVLLGHGARTGPPDAAIPPQGPARDPAPHTCAAMDPLGSTRCRRRAPVTARVGRSRRFAERPPRRPAI